ncbi:MAG: UvrB/UvrC motif-containing protein [Planctomycetota bacterium]
MRCQICQKNPATIHVLDLVGTEWVGRWTCEDCARGEGADGGQDPLKVIKFFGQILGGQAATAPLGKGTASGDACPGCGMTYEQFQQTKRLGCPRCYETFQVDLEQIFMRVQENVLHRGKVPGRPKTAPPTPLELRRLHEQLGRAVEEERFEEAARLRDKIQELSRGDEG